jgi:hypothetical protein
MGNRLIAFAADGVDKLPPHDQERPAGSILGLGLQARDRRIGRYSARRVESLVQARFDPMPADRERPSLGIG